MLKQDHIIYSSSESVKKICEPLFSQLNLNYFRYMRIYSDHRRIILSSNPEWTEHFFSNKFYEVAWFDNKPFDFHQSGTTLWNVKAIKEDNQVGKDSRDMFNMFHGITIAKRHSDFTEFIDFTAPSEHINTETIFNTNPYLLNRFILFFKDQGDKIIKDAVKRKIRLPIDVSSNVLNSRLDPIAETDFLNTIKVKNFYISDEIKFTARQVDCIELLHNGLSIEDIAKKLFIAERTVETHIQNAKNALKCKKREDLIRILIQEGIIIC